MGHWTVLSVLLPSLLVLLTLCFSYGKRHSFWHPVSASPSQKRARQSNWFDPRIISAKGRSFKAYVNDTVLSSVVVSDLHGSVRVNCDISCLESAASSTCPLFKVITSDVSLFMGSVLFNASAATTSLGPLLFNLTCTDPGRPSRASTVPFSVIFVKNATSAFHEPSVTKQLIDLGSEPLQRKPPNEMLLFVKMLTNVTNSNNFSTIDVALVSAITAEIVDILNAGKNNSDIMLQQVTEFISNISERIYRARQDSEAMGSVISQLCRITNKLVTAINIDPSLHKNKTFTSIRLAVSAMGIDSGSKKRGSVITFGSSDGNLQHAKISPPKSKALNSISLHSDQILGGRVGFVMIEDYDSLSIKGNITVLSAIFSVCGQLRGNVLLSGNSGFFVEAMTLGLIVPWPFFKAYELLFCASWNTQSLTWERQRCSSVTITHQEISCHCSRHTFLAVLIDEKAMDKFWNDFDLIVNYLVMGSNFLFVTSAALCFTIFAHCRYVRRRWTSARHMQANTILAVERGWMTIIMAAILLAIELNLIGVIFGANWVGCLGRDTITLFCYLLFSFFSVLQGWQSFLCLVSRIVLHSLQTTNLGSVYGCFNRSWGLMVFVVILLALFLCLISVYVSPVLNYNTLLIFCHQGPAGIPLYLGFVLPLTLCFVADMVISGLLGYALIWRSSDLPLKHRSRSWNKAVGYVAVCVTFYTTAMVGMLPSDTTCFLFPFFNTLLGIVYFVFNCVTRAEIRKEVIRTFRCYSWCCNYWTRRHRRYSPGPSDYETGEESRALLGQEAS